MMPLMQWLGPEDAEARAAHLLLLSAGLFCIASIAAASPTPPKRKRRSGNPTQRSNVIVLKING